jgi:nucleotide-binding universal stress UspA family protein
MRRSLGGTVAARLLHGAPCGVLVAPRGWSDREHSGIGVIGVGYDGGGESKIALAHAEELAKTTGAKLKVITIAPYFGVDAHLGPIVAMRQMWGKTLDEGVHAVSSEVATERVLRQGKEASELGLAGADVDLLVVGSRGYGPLRRALAGSVSIELVRKAPCPVLVVPRGAEDRVAAETLAAVA